MKMSERPFAPAFSLTAHPRPLFPRSLKKAPSFKNGRFQKMEISYCYIVDCYICCSFYSWTLLPRPHVEKRVEERQESGEGRRPRVETVPCRVAAPACAKLKWSNHGSDRDSPYKQRYGKILASKKEAVPSLRPRRAHKAKCARSFIHV